MLVFGGLSTSLSSLQPWIISKLMIDYFRRKFYLNFLILNSILLYLMTYNVGVYINGKKKEVKSA